MAQCRICGRPATAQVTMRQNGRTEQIALCDEHYNEAMGQNRMSASPLESLFGGGLFDRFFGDAWPGMFDPPGGTCGACRSAGSARAKRWTCSPS
ncbi:MAG: hypothetical protein REJ24_02325 [Rhodocyclaceae bacterium]|nr:hypothetical protein [Rhodocyclaceae bacterium]